jgi:hypothetical protein
MSMNQIKKIVSEVLAEAKKKKKKGEALKAAYEAKPGAYGYAEAFDFSAPLGAYNLYKNQGAVNWGPMTGPGTKIDDNYAGGVSGTEKALRSYVRDEIREQVESTWSAWDVLSEAITPPDVVEDSPWGEAMEMANSFGVDGQNE